MLGNVGHRIKELREEKGLTLDQLAKIAKIDTSTLWRYEAGDIRNPSMNVLATLCDALNVPITSFFETVSRTDVKLAKTVSFDPDTVTRRIAMLSPHSRRSLLDFLAYIEAKEANFPRRKPRTTGELLISGKDDHCE